MGIAPSVESELQTIITTSANEFMDAHCLLDDNETTDAHLFMECFVRFTIAKHSINLTMCTSTWMAQLIQTHCTALRFIGNSPRLSKIPFTYHYMFSPTTVLGLKLVNLQLLWPKNVPSPP